MASVLGLHNLPMSLLWDTSHKLAEQIPSGMTLKRLVFNDCTDVACAVSFRKNGAISVSPHVTFILDFILISMFLR